MKEIFLNPPIALATSRTTFPCPLAPHNTKSPISPRLGWAPQELRHRGMARLADTLSPQYLQHRHPQDLDIKRKAPMIHVPHVQLELLFPSEAVASVHLRPSGDTWLHLVALAFERGVSGQVFGEQRARPDQAHIAIEHAPKCRELVETGDTQQPAVR